MKEESITLKPKKLKILFYLVLCFMFFLFFLYAVKYEKSFIVWMGLVFFGIGTAVFIIEIFPNSSFLNLNQKGFLIKGLFCSHFCEWKHVKEFYPIKIGRNKMVGIKFSSEYERLEVVREIVKNIAGAEGSLPDTYGMKAEKLAELMNKWKNKYGSSK